MLDNEPHLTLGTFCPLRRLVPGWEFLSLGKLNPLGRFVPWHFLSLGRFVWGRFILGRFVSGSFVCAPHKELSNSEICQNFSNGVQACRGAGTAGGYPEMFSPCGSRQCRFESCQLGEREICTYSKYVLYSYIRVQYFLFITLEGGWGQARAVYC